MLIFENFHTFLQHTFHFILKDQEKYLGCTNYSKTGWSFPLCQVFSFHLTQTMQRCTRAFLISPPTGGWQSAMKKNIRESRNSSALLFPFHSAVPIRALSHQPTSLSLRCHAHGSLAKHLMHMAHFSGNTSGSRHLTG